MRTFIKYILIVFVALLVISSLFTLFQSPEDGKGGTAEERSGLTELVTEINAGNVERIVIKGDHVEVTFADQEDNVTFDREPGAAFTETLQNLGADLTKTQIETDSASGTWVIIGSTALTLLPFLIIGIFLWLMLRQAQRGTMNAFSFGKSKARLAAATDGKKKVMFKDVAGLEEVKEEVTEVVDFLKNPNKYLKLGARIPKGILLIGGPGTGKTLLAKAVANEANVPFHFVSGSEFVEMFVGVGATRVRDTFEAAKKTAPAIIFVDEIDAVGRHRGAGMGGGHDEREQTLNQILVEMDGFDTNDAVIVMAATNRPDILDPALLRPGRFDRRIVLSEPSIKDREAILAIHGQGKPLAADIDLRKVAERTSGFSGADLANLINEAAILAARHNQKEITQLNLFTAIEKVLLGPEKRSHVFNEKEKEIAAYHEAGHALVAVSMPNTDPVHKVSIVSRGRAGGYTLKLPTEDRHLRSRKEYESELAVLMGGFAAEQIMFNDMTTGVSNDIKVASDLARQMVTKFGMSSKLGPIVFGDESNEVFLGKEFGHVQNYSDEVAGEIDDEVKTLITDALTKAKKAIQDKMETLHTIAKELIAKEVLEQEEFYALIKA